MKPYFLSALHPTQPLALGGSEQGELRLADWNQRRLLHRWLADFPVEAVALHPTRPLAAAVGPEGMALWEEGRQVARWPHVGDRVLFAESRLYLGMRDGLKAIHLDSGEEAWVREEPGFENPTLIAVGPQHIAWSAMACSDVLILDPATGHTVRQIASVGEVYALAFHPDGKRLVASLTNRRDNMLNQIQMFNLVTGEIEKSFLVPFQSVAVAVSPDFAWVATGDAMGAQLWDASQGQPERRFARRETASIPGLGQLERPQAGLVSAIRFDGPHLVTDGHELAVWELATGNLLWSLEVSRADV